MRFLQRFLFATAIVLALGSGAAYGIHAYTSMAAFAPASDIVSPLGLTEPITIRFEKPVATKDYLKRVAISPNKLVSATWDKSSTNLTLTPQTPWKADTAYSISLPEGTTNTLVPVSAAVVSFTTVPFPEVVAITPKDGSKDLLLGIEDPITVTLKNMSDDFFIDFRFDPPREIAYENNADRTEFRLLPKTPLEEGGAYSLEIFAFVKDDSDQSQKLGMSRFSTLPPPPQTWPRNILERVEQAKRFTRAKITQGKYIDINLTAQVMSIFEGETLLDSFPISSGKRGMNTPTGSFSVRNKAPRPWSKQYSLYMPYWMAITGDGKYGIHELPEWPGGYKEGANHLGIPVSHGCVRLGIGPAKRVFEWAEIGTPIVIY